MSDEDDGVGDHCDHNPNNQHSDSVALHYHNQQRHFLTSSSTPTKSLAYSFQQQQHGFQQPSASKSMGAGGGYSVVPHYNRSLSSAPSSHSGYLSAYESHQPNPNHNLSPVPLSNNGYLLRKMVPNHQMEPLPPRLTLSSLGSLSTSPLSSSSSDSFVSSSSGVPTSASTSSSSSLFDMGVSLSRLALHAEGAPIIVCEEAGTGHDHRSKRGPNGTQSTSTGRTPGRRKCYRFVHSVAPPPNYPFNYQSNRPDEATFSSSGAYLPSAGLSAYQHRLAQKQQQPSYFYPGQSTATPTQPYLAERANGAQLSSGGCVGVNGQLYLHHHHYHHFHYHHYLNSRAQAANKDFQQATYQMSYDSASSDPNSMNASSVFKGASNCLMLYPEEVNSSSSDEQRYFKPIQASDYCPGGEQDGGDCLSTASSSSMSFVSPSVNPAEQFEPQSSFLEPYSKQNLFSPSASHHHFPANKSSNIEPIYADRQSFMRSASSDLASHPMVDLMVDETSSLGSSSLEDGPESIDYSVSSSSATSCSSSSFSSKEVFYSCNSSEYFCDESPLGPTSHFRHSAVKACRERSSPDPTINGTGSVAMSVVPPASQSEHNSRTSLPSTVQSLSMSLVLGSLSDESLESSSCSPSSFSSSSSSSVFSATCSSLPSECYPPRTAPIPTSEVSSRSTIAHTCVLPFGSSSSILMTPPSSCSSSSSLCPSATSGTASTTICNATSPLKSIESVDLDPQSPKLLSVLPNRRHQFPRTIKPRKRKKKDKVKQSSAPSDVLPVPPASDVDLMPQQGPNKTSPTTTTTGTSQHNRSHYCFAESGPMTSLSSVNPLRKSPLSAATNFGPYAPSHHQRSPFAKFPNSSPPQRPWIHLKKPSPSAVASVFTVMCYNVLCDKYATRQLYGYCPNWALSWDYRRNAIMQEIKRYDADIISLQEVETEQFYNFFHPELLQIGYDGIFSPKSRAKTMTEQERRHVDGCAIFFKADKFSLVKEHLVEFNQMAMANAEGCGDMLNRVMTKDNIGLAALLQTKDSDSDNNLSEPSVSANQPLIVCTAHIHWDPEYCDVKLIQTMMLMHELRNFVDEAATMFKLVSGPTTNSAGKSIIDSNLIPIILCGDLNSLPESGVVEFLSNGRISVDHPDFKEIAYKESLRKLCPIIEKNGNDYSHAFDILKAYKDDIMPFTNYTYDFKGVIDYIFCSKQSMSVLGVLGALDPNWLRDNKIPGCPHQHIPSDHFPLVVELEMIPKQISPGLLSTGTNSSSANSSSASSSTNSSVATTAAGTGSSAGGVLLSNGLTLLGRR